ncbi:MAG: cyclophilin type peptidyl-prolyl cis-trans isomerase [Gammaproteobacteria bacterium]|nr:cyclophilin type peptidyl-prolyl cis-trans isomerase [Gammaproteobacteria bacterium]
MKFAASLCLSVALFTGAARAQEATAPQVQFKTSLGSITVALDPAHAPKTAANFLRYVKEGHFDGTVIYRVVPGFVLQAGSYGPEGDAKSAHEPIPLETSSGLTNMRGSLSMARSSYPASATAEFFINLSDNPALDPDAGAPADTTGYAVFGKVVDGMDVVDKIAATPTGSGKGPFPDASPITPVVIEKVTLLAAPASAAPVATPAPGTQPAPAH